MQLMPRKWTLEELAIDAFQAMEVFRTNRVQEPKELYKRMFAEALQRAEHVLEASDNLLGLEASVPGLILGGYYDVIRYLMAPPISEDDMHTIAGLSSKSARRALSEPNNAARIYAIVSQTLDEQRFAWLESNRAPTKDERAIAAVSTAALLATQQVQTLRRSLAKVNQENGLKSYLSSELSYGEVSVRKIMTVFDAPKAREFCGETMVAGKKADVVVGLGDGRFMCVECKVSNSEVNSFKRLNHETVEKATHWYRSFGTNGVVCAALLSGVFKVGNLRDAQDADVSLFWSHGLGALGTFVTSTYGTEIEFCE